MSKTSVNLAGRLDPARDIEATARHFESPGARVSAPTPQDYTYSLRPPSDEERMLYPVIGRIAGLADQTRKPRPKEPSWLKAARRRGWIVKVARGVA